MEFGRLQGIITEVLNIKTDEITLGITLMGDLGAGSLDISQVIMAIGKELNIEIPTEEAKKIVSMGDAARQVKSAPN